MAQLTASLSILLVTLGSAIAADPHPNIVLVMADDLGYGDPRCYNAESKCPTPNIDRLAAEGMRFTDAHAPAALCVPTRYGLLTGRYPLRMTPGAKGPLISPERTTLAGLLADRGYHAGCVGKWHLGLEDDDYSQPLAGGPVDRGFHTYFGIPASLDIPPYYYIDGNRCVEPPTSKIEANYSEGVTRIQGAFWRAGGVAPSFRHADVLPTFAKKAVEYIDGRAQEPEQPFFLYLALPAPHTPWLPNEPFQGKSQAGDYGDFVVQVDHIVGQVLEALQRHQFSDNTLVIFTSDNGPVWYEADRDRYDHRCTGPLRGMKGDAWEGGHRMPFVARWPGQIEAEQVSDETICHTDLLATLASILGEKLPSEEGADSYNLLPVLLGEECPKPLREATIHQSASRVLAIRQGPWKLIPALGSGGFSQPRSEKPKPGQPPGQLYNLRDDLAEANNLWDQQPEIVHRLTHLLKRYQAASRTAPKHVE